MKWLEDFQRRMDALIDGSPAADIKKNMKAVMAQQFARLDLVNREDFEVQAALIAKLGERLSAVEARLKSLEQEKGIPSA